MTDPIAILQYNWNPPFFLSRKQQCFALINGVPYGNTPLVLKVGKIKGGGYFRNSPKNTKFLLREISDEGKTRGVFPQGGVFPLGTPLISHLKQAGLPKNRWELLQSGIGLHLLQTLTNLRGRGEHFTNPLFY